MGKDILTIEQVRNLKKRPAFSDETKAQMERRWAEQENVYQLEKRPIDGKLQPHVKCQACGLHGQAATMEIGHIRAWKPYIIEAMQSADMTEISAEDLRRLFNDPANLRWEHALCNGHHVFEEGNPFDPGLLVDDQGRAQKVAMLKTAKFVRESGLSDMQIAAMTPQDFLDLGNARFAPEPGEDIQDGACAMGNGALVRIVDPPAGLGVADPDFDLDHVKREQLEWFPNTRKALFQKWNNDGHIRKDGRVTYLRCGVCHNFTEASSMHRGHVVVWKTHLARVGVRNMDEARAAYNDLNNLRFECSKCNTSHDWEDLSTREQDAIDNAMYRISTASGVFDENQLMRTLVFGDMADIPGNITVDGDLMRRIQTFASQHKSMELLQHMAGALAQELDAEAKVRDLQFDAQISESLVADAEERAKEALLEAEYWRTTATAQRHNLNQTAGLLRQREAEGNAAGMSLEAFAAFQQDMLSMFEGLRAGEQDVLEVEQRAQILEDHAAGRKEDARKSYVEAVEAHRQLDEARKALEAAKAHRKKVRDHGAPLTGEALRQAEAEAADYELYYLLRAGMNEAQTDVLMLLEAAARIEREIPGEREEAKIERLMSKVAGARLCGGPNFRSPEFGDEAACLDIVRKAFKYARFEARELKKQPEAKVTVGGQTVPIDTIYDYMLVVNETNAAPNDILQAFMRDLNAA